MLGGEVRDQTILLTAGGAYGKPLGGLLQKGMFKGPSAGWTEEGQCSVEDAALVRALNQGLETSVCCCRATGFCSD